MHEGMPPPPGAAGSLESWERVLETGPRDHVRRPVAVTIAGVLLLVAGAFAGLAGGLIVLTGDGATIEGIGGSETTIAVIAALVLAVLEVASGVLVLRTSHAGRVLGIVVAALGIGGGLAAIASPQGLVTIAIFGFVVYALVTNARAFRRTRDQ